jgi:hypothetical protein
LPADQPLQAAALDAPVSGLAVEQEYLGQADARFPLDLAVELDEGSASSAAKCISQRALASAAQSDEREPLAARRGFFAVVAHKPEHDVFETVRRQPIQKPADEAFLDRGLHADR